MLVDAPQIAAVISMAHLMMKFPVEDENQRVIGVGVYGGTSTWLENVMCSQSGPLRPINEQKIEEEKRT